MTEVKPVRIDKFLWAVRIYKTRSLASEECRKGRILISNIQVKPSRLINPGDLITVKKMPVVYTYRVINPIENRVSAKMAPGFVEDLTPEDEKVKLKLGVTGSSSYREKGTGRPTKKERRTLDKFTGNPGTFKGW